jgi:hypothetical protein
VGEEVVRGDLLELGGGAATTQAGTTYYPPGVPAPYFQPRGALVQLSTTSGGFITFTGSSPVWVFEAAKKLEALGRLRPGWDSYGGLPLNPESQALTLNVLGWLGSDELPTPAVVLGSEGNVHLEWRVKGRELEVGLGRGQRVAFVKVYPNGDIEEGEQSANLPQQLRGLTCWLMQGEQAPAR